MHCHFPYFNYQKVIAYLLFGCFFYKQTIIYITPRFTFNIEVWIETIES